MFHMRQQFLFNVEPLVSIYTARKIHQNNLESIFSVDPKVCSNKLTGSFFPLAKSFQSGSKNLNKRQYLGIRAFHVPLRVQMNVLNKQNKYGEHNVNLNFTRCRLNVDNSRQKKT